MKLERERRAEKRKGESRKSFFRSSETSVSASTLTLVRDLVLDDSSPSPSNRHQTRWATPPPRPSSARGSPSFPSLSRARPRRWRWATSPSRATPSSSSGPRRGRRRCGTSRRRIPGLVIVDYTLPTAVNDNALFYCENGVPFVMGTTGGDSVKLLDDVKKSGNWAVIAPQMGKQVVALQATLELMSERFPGAFGGYSLRVTESHQAAKADTSGTAKAIVESFVKLGAKARDGKCVRGGEGHRPRPRQGHAARAS